MTMFCFKFTANIFSREDLEADQQPIGTFHGHLEAESHAAATKKAGALTYNHCQDQELKTGHMVGFEKLVVEIDDSPTEAGIRSHASKILREIESKELTTDTFNWHYQQQIGLFLTYQLVAEILQGEVERSALDAPIPALAECLSEQPQVEVQIPNKS